jgi:hypothetical protein
MSEMATAIWLVGYGFTIVWEHARTPAAQRKADRKESPGAHFLGGVLSIIIWLFLGPLIIRGF